MAITYTTNAKSAEWDYTEEAGKLTGKTVHIVRTSEPTYPSVVAANAPDLIARGGDYPGTTGTCFCTKRTTTPDDGTRMLFRVECDFDSSSTYTANPLNDATKVSYSEESVEETYFYDEGNPVNYPVWSNGRPFPEEPKRDASIRVITITKNVAATTTIATLDAIRNTINIAPVVIDAKSYAVGELKVTSTALSEVKTDNGYMYREQTVTAKAKVGGWDQKFSGRDTVDVDGKPKVLDSGAINDAPWPLTDVGNFATNQSDTPYVETLKPYKRAVHSVIV